MTARTFDELFETKRRPTLTLEETQTGKFTCIDETGRVYFYPSTYDMDVVIRFMRAMAIRGHATLDEGSITWFRALRAEGEFSVGVGSLSEREAPFEPDSRSESDRRTRLLKFLGRPEPTRCPRCKARPDDVHAKGCPYDLPPEIDRKSERGTKAGGGLTAADPHGGAGLTAAPVTQAATVDDEPAPSLSEIGAASPHPPVPGAAPITLRLVN